MDIREIDKNFDQTIVFEGDMEFFPMTRKELVVEGLPFFYENGQIERLPMERIDQCNTGVHGLSKHTAGGCVRFVTDSRVLHLRAEIPDACEMYHMPRLGKNGFDGYCGTGKEKRWIFSTAPEMNETKVDLTVKEFETNELREITINLPLYNGVQSLLIGVEKGSKIESPAPHRMEAPVVFYGSSITQGGCASRPGNAYTAMIGRKLDIPTLNLGFSGSAHGEPQMAELIAGMEMSLFVLDYDYNAPTPEHLKKTHAPFYQTVRKQNPDLPIILVSRCSWADEKDREERLDIIRETYEQAKAAGDDHVYFLDGGTLFDPFFRDECTMDGCHPNDLGFACMAKGIGTQIERILFGGNEVF